jgi:hypothetical protein
MALIIHQDAQDHIKLISKMMTEVGNHEDADDVAAMIFNHALYRGGCIDSGDLRCEGTAAPYDLYVFRESHSSTDFYWRRFDRTRQEWNGDGGFNCHTEWFRRFMAGAITKSDLWLELKDTRYADRKVEWSVNT